MKTRQQPELTETIGDTTSCDLQYQALQVPIAGHHLITWSY